MYYIDDEITLMQNFNEPVIKGFHIITRYNIDLVNNIMQIELGSFDNKDSLINGSDNGYISFLTLNDTPKFGVEPTLFALRALTSISTSPLLNKEIKIDSNIKHFSQIKNN